MFQNLLTDIFAVYFKVFWSKLVPIAYSPIYGNQSVFSMDVIYSEARSTLGVHLPV